MDKAYEYYLNNKMDTNTLKTDFIIKYKNLQL